MAFRHARWEKNGRLFQSDSDANKFQWKTASADDENVDLGGGSYAPYVWDGTELRHARASIVFLPNFQEIRFNGETKIKQQKFHFDVETSPGVWKQVTTKAPPQLVVDPQDDHIVASLVWDIEHPDRAEKIAWKTSFIVGNHGNTAVVNQEITSNSSIKVRVRATNKGLDRTQPVRDRITKRKGQPDIVGGKEVGGIRWRWSVAEAPDREVNVSDVGNDKDAEIIMGAGVLEAGVTKKISPDTFGSTEISTDAHDGSEYDSSWNNTYDYDGFDVWGDYANRGDSANGGIQFTGLPSNIGDIVSVDTGSSILYDTNYGDSGMDIGWRTIIDADPSDFSKSYLPRDQTLSSNVKTTTGQTVPGSDNSTGEIGGSTGILDDWMDGVTPVSGNSIAFILQQTNTGSCQIIDSSDTVTNAPMKACRLTMEYTVSGGTTVPVMYHHYRTMKGA
jgi:hypothetical protein